MVVPVVPLKVSYLDYYCLCDLEKPVTPHCQQVEELSFSDCQDTAVKNVEADESNSNTDSASSSKDEIATRVSGYLLFNNSRKVVYKLDNGEVKSFKAAAKAEKNMPPHDLYFERGSEGARWKRIFKCNYHNCDHEFSKAWLLIDHYRSHTELRPFKCDQCSA